MDKKKLAIVSFTPQGKVLAGKISDIFKEPVLGESWEVETADRPIPMKQWMETNFSGLDGLVFIGAIGIIVREMAPFLRSKLSDPGVVVLDERGQFAISVLSGHLGGANELTRELAGQLGCVPVITTSSDVNGKIAIDVFAKKNHLTISSMKQAKYCAMAIISGKKVSFSCEGAVNGIIPLELSGKREDAKFHVTVTPHIRENSDNELHLIPKAFILGVGCKKNTSASVIEKRIKEELEKNRIDVRSIKGIASIDIKSEEQGLIEFAEKYHIPLSFYSFERLAALEGAFTPSEFVSGITGVDNVCERSAFLLAKENGMKTLKECLVMPKSGKDGVTVAITKTDWSVGFE